MPRYIDADKLKERKFDEVQFEHYFESVVSSGLANADDVVYAYKVGYNEAIDNIVDFEPTADVVERKRGKWYDVGSLSCRCSECGCKSQKESSFCPHCGAEMRGEEYESSASTAKGEKMENGEYKHWCGNCQIRIYIQRHYGDILTRENCPYPCEYAAAMRCSTEAKGESDE